MGIERGGFLRQLTPKDLEELAYASIRNGPLQTNLVVALLAEDVMAFPPDRVAYSEDRPDHIFYRNLNPVSPGLYSTQICDGPNLPGVPWVILNGKDGKERDNSPRMGWPDWYLRQLMKKENGKYEVIVFQTGPLLIG